MLHIRIAAMQCFIADVIRTYDWLISNINDNNKRHVLFFHFKNRHIISQISFTFSSNMNSKHNLYYQCMY